ncbi:hypothetical protein TCAL_13190 [Tigriopus californicus]|uniref:ADAM10 endopeptidase n=1 Tax=Tigriopus californicus TaxID=6832 RepID=A0A553NVI5_TIGCA|nr:hypothetical protein TCAL_13190 [Tigriopus californicus]
MLEFLVILEQRDRKSSTALEEFKVTKDGSPSETRSLRDLVHSSGSSINSSRMMVDGLKLNEFVHHFEPAFFALDHVVAQHQDLLHSRRKREIAGQPQWKDMMGKPDIQFNFTAHNRLFQLELHESSHGIFSDDITFENTNGPIDYAMEKVYSGVLRDTPDSQIHGVLTEDGHFDGHISTPSEHYYIEPAHRYFPSAKRGSIPKGTNKGQGSESEEAGDLKADEGAAVEFHSVIYKASDVHHPTSNPEAPCKSHELHLRNKEAKAHLRPEDWPQLVAASKSFKHKPVITHNSNTKPLGRSKRAATVPESIQTGPKGPPHAEKQTVTTYEVLDWADVPESVRHHFRKRAKTLAANKKIDPKKTTCMLYLQADHLFYEKMGSEEATIDVMTRHVQRVNSIYKEIDFDQDGKPDNISFMIKRIKVHTRDSLKDPKYRFPGNYGVEKFLEIFSEENYDAFCLAYMFTYRDFEGGTLGLAWTGDLKNAGGVCERNGHYRGSLKSLNTGIITLLNYGKHVPPAVSHVTLAHEMGHNFGSPHDPENNKVCVPGGEDGNYIMFARATSGDKRNNRQFSPCSLKSVKNVLTIKARGAAGCFTEPKEALCGNGVVEEGEECDCGWEEDCEEECCWPQRTQALPNQTPCTLRPTKVCSPTQGPCCTNDCSFKLGDKCRDDNGCREESFCDGTASICPYSELKANKTVCNKEFVCYKGECTGSICLAYGMESCQCSQGPEDAPTKACELCCKDPGLDKPCLSSFELNDVPFDIPDMFSKPGTPCNNYQGYCDVFQMCREVDPSGPLATLRKLLLSEEAFVSLRDFLMSHWYAAIFIILAIGGLMVLIIRFCGKKSPLVVRSKRRRRHATIHHDVETSGPLTVALPPEDEDQVQVHPTAIETSVPLGKKVRKGENRKERARKKSSTQETSSSKGRGGKKKSSSASSPTHALKEGSTGRVDGAVSRATQLAANLSQLIVNLPPDLAMVSGSQNDPYKKRHQKRNNSSQHAPGKSSPSTKKPGTDEEASDSGSSSSSEDDEPEMSSATLNAPESSGNKQKSSSPSKRARTAEARGGEKRHKRGRSQSGHKRASKSLSPVKRTSKISQAASHLLADSMTSISKSMEKLDIIGQRRRRERRAKNSTARAISADDGRKKSRKRTDLPANEATGGGEGVGGEAKPDDTNTNANEPFFEPLLSEGSGASQPNKRLSASKDTRKDESEESFARRAADGATPPSFAPTNLHGWHYGRSQSVDNASQHPSVIVSKQHQPDRPLQQRKVSLSQGQGHPGRKKLSGVKTPTRSASTTSFQNQIEDEQTLLSASSSNDLGVSDYRLDFPPTATGLEGQKKFARSVSSPGPGPLDKNDLIMVSRHQPSKSSGSKRIPPISPSRKYSFANDKRPDLEKLYQLRRSASTIGEEDLVASNQNLGRAASKSLLLTPSPTEEGRPKVRKSSNPNLGTASEPASRLSSLKKQLQAHWDQSDGKHQYLAMREQGSRSREEEDVSEEEDEIEESDVSSIDSKERLSPPTQVQSLSEDTSSLNSSSKIQSPTEFDISSGTSSDEELAIVQSTKPSVNPKKDIISRKRILAAVTSATSHHSGTGKKHSIPEANSRVNLIPSSSSNTSSSCASLSSSSRSSLLVDDESGPSVSEDGAPRAHLEPRQRAQSSEPSPTSLDYLKNYGEVPRLLEAAARERKQSQGDQARQTSNNI